MQKIIINVTETVYHTVKLELNDADMNKLVSSLNDDDNDVCNDIAGDYCNDETINDGHYDVDDYEVIKC